MLNAKKEETHLEKNDTAVKICGTTEGRLPGSCAPLAFPYVPVQCDNPARYSQQDALQAGTLFPGLNLPFHADMETRFPAANTRRSGGAGALLVVYQARARGTGEVSGEVRPAASDRPDAGQL